jgi:Flp pilus assembly protein TadD
VFNSNSDTSSIEKAGNKVVLDPNNPITHHLLGQAYCDLGDAEEAERELKTAQQLGAKNDANP